MMGTQDHDMSPEESLADETDQDVNHLIVTFTRYLFINRLVEEKELTETYARIFDDAEAEELQSTLEEINDALENSKLKITTGKCELTDKNYYLLISTHFRPNQAWPSAMFNESELNFVKNVIHEIILADLGLVTKERILNRYKNVPISEANRILKMLVEKQYLLEPREGKYALSVLALNELEPFINYTYKEALKKCLFCKRFMFFGGRCENCKSPCHFCCLNTFKQSMNKAIKCPSCNKPWNREGCQSFEELLNQEDDFEDEE